MAYVYEWIRLDTNEPFYVGKGNDFRCYELVQNRNPHFKYIINKVGVENVAVSFLHEDIDDETALGLEIYYIYLYREEFGYDLANITDGGDGVKGWTQNVSEEKLLEFKKKRSDATIGSNNPMYGVSQIFTEESKAKMSKSLKNNQNNAKGIILYFNGIFYKEYKSITEATIEFGGKFVTDSIGKRITSLLNGWIPTKGQFFGFSASFK